MYPEIIIFLLIFQRITNTNDRKTMLVHANNDEEKTLLQGLHAGDQAAFASLYAHYAPQLIGYAAARLSSLEEARDIIQDLFVYLWDERQNININISLRSYLFTAVRYRIIDHIRHQLTRREYATWAKLLIQRVNAEVEEEVAVNTSIINWNWR